jgi:hypothetical protein
MLKISEIVDGLYKTNDLPSYLLQHVATVDHLYSSSVEYLGLLSALREVVGDFYRKQCPILFEDKAIKTKEWLNEHRSEWELDGYSCFDNWTSGTTAERFKYRIHNDVYYRLEYFEHYIEILREFFVAPSRLFYMISDDIDLDGPIFKTIRTDNAVISHGLRESVEAIQINRNRLSFDDHFAFYSEIFKFLEAEPVDLILADGNSISELLCWARKNNYQKKIAKLLSTTTCMVVEDDLESLRTSGLIDNWCDHMRCWDGGVTFFSCKHRTRHLVEHFSYPISINGKLVSQDFFSFPNPFWNYWNGDMVELDDEYKRCECGRIYREFKITRERDVNMLGVYSYEIDKSLDDVDCLKRSVRCGDLVKVFTSRPLTSQERMRIRARLPNIHYRFVAEE